MRALDSLAILLKGTQLIEANAGTGKTHAATTLYLRLLLEGGLPVERILLVTYTNAATAELRRKVRARIAAALAALRDSHPADEDDLAEMLRSRQADGHGPADRARLAAALYGFDAAAIYTIHGFCQRVLQEHAFESGVPFDAELMGDQRLLIDDTVRDFWTGALYEAPIDLVRSLDDSPKLSPVTLARLVAKAAANPDLQFLPTADDLGRAGNAGREHPSGGRRAVAAGGGETAPDDARAARIRLQLDAVGFAQRELRRRKAATNSQSFDDLLQRLAAALDGNGGEALAVAIRRRFAAAIVDEFQDTDPIQCRIFERIFTGADAGLFLIGDPKQAIYGFRGADVFAYMRAKRRLADEAYTLDVNRRSGPALIRAVNTLFGRARAQFVFPDIAFTASHALPDACDALAGAAAGRAPLRVVFVGRDGHARPGGQMNRRPAELPWFHAAVAGEISRLLNAETYIAERRILPGDVAVLCDTNAHSAELQAQLSALGVPTVRYGDASVFEAPEAEAVARVVRALVDPADTAAIGAALLTPILGLTADDLAAARADDRAWETWVERFRAWHECWLTSGFTVAFRRLFDECEVAAHVLARQGGERTLTNVLHLGELLHVAAVDARRGPRALLEWLERMRGDAHARAEETADAAQIRLERDTHSLTLTTIHKSKGLQYPVVVCPFLWDGMLLHPNDKHAAQFHAPDDDQRRTIDLGSPRVAQHLERAKREALAEKLRVLYVALTRAQQLCMVVWGQFRDCQKSPLGYLLHQPSDAPDDVLAQATEARIKKLSDAEMRADLSRLAADSDGAIEIGELSLDEPPRLAASVAIGPPLSVRTMRREVRQAWRLASFSALASAERELPEPVEEGVDRDEVAETPSVAAAAEASPAVRGFPRGRRLGNLMHALFETIDFRERDAVRLREHALRLLPAFGVELKWADALCATLSDVLDTPLTTVPPPEHLRQPATSGGGALTLRQIAPAHRLNELEFLFPVALEDGVPAGGVTPAGLAGVLATGPGWLADYADRVRQLSFPWLAGYLKGFIDLVFAHDERWFVVDYKTNDLGGRVQDYHQARLLAEMQRHHYVLQYHLYSVAVHRYLERRLTGYDYERHFGGVLYLFVRGMAPAHEPGCGIFFDRPAPALIAALSDLFARPGTVRR